MGVETTIDTAINRVKPAAAYRRTLAKGAHLFREGDTANRIFEVESGVLRLTRVMANGRRQVIAFGYPGDVVGFPSDGRTTF